ncbi:phosphoenolpyruvate--protein phosphotransferase [Desertibaculum subflavum]|uniref:phosphoenolpyruvate--protein phosphotransferase n=1 Tax=Desertibaculum subflavum TaxID=2268458 RepID=UPI0034D1B142
MAGTGSAQARLSLVVKVVAANMVAEVCSVYLLRAGEVLELFATEGLKPEAVHVTRLRTGEGLVGDIAAHARPLNLPDAQAHPQYAYRPETGEEIYHSFLGVPIMRASRVIGVLVVQNRTRRRYADEEVEALETVAMVISEVVGSGQLISREEIAEVDGIATLPHRLTGRVLAEGIAVGTAVLHEPHIVVEKTIAEDIGLEKRRLQKGVGQLRASVDEMMQATEQHIGSDSREVLETYRMFANDAGWLRKMHEAVESGLTAEAAVQKVQIDNRMRMQSVSDPYLKERLSDLDDLANRLLLHVIGRTGTAAAGKMPEDAILFARNMGPAELLDYEASRPKAVVLEEGSPTSHVAIVARSLGIPMLGRCEGAIRRVDFGDPVIVDADHGQIYIRPAEDIVAAFRKSLDDRREREAKYLGLRDLPAVTRCGETIRLKLNAGLLVDVGQVNAMAADGIGLYRTELLFMVRHTFPNLEAQVEIYSKVLDEAGERPVCFRTLDIGGDKVLPYMPRDGAEKEENPAMGWRAIRLALDRPAILKTQLRALLRAAAGRRLDVMFPMVAEAAELIRAKEIFERERRRLGRQGLKEPAEIRIGTMLEVPSLAFQLDAVLPQVDFISVGSNDLTQFLFAADRGSSRIADRYDPLSPPMLGFLRHVARACTAVGKPLAVCGEMAARPVEAMALIGLGVRELSMPASALGPVKEMVRSLAIPPLADYLEQIISLPDHSLRSRLMSFAQDHGVAI